MQSLALDGPGFSGKPPMGLSLAGHYLRTVGWLHRSSGPLIVPSGKARPHKIVKACQLNNQRK